MNVMALHPSGRRPNTLRRLVNVVWGSLLIAVLLSACDNNDDNLTGIWFGDFTQELQGRVGTMKLTLTQSGRSLGGRWDAEFPPGLSFGGTVEGLVTGSSVDADLRPDDPEICPYRWTATWSRDRITGRYAAFDCRVEIQGEINVRRQ